MSLGTNQVQSIFSLVIVWILVFITLSTIAVADQSSAVSVGFHSQLKLGCWTPISFQLAPDSKAKKFEILAPDGQGIPFVTSGDLIFDKSNQRFHAWFRTGRSIGQLVAKILTADSEVVETFEIELGSNAAKVLDSITTIGLTIESSDTIAQDIGSLKNQLFGQQSEIIGLSDVASLPASTLGYDGIHIIYLTTSDANLIHSISDLQWDALESWVASGGKLVFGAGENCESVLADSSPLARFLPGEFDGSVSISKSFRFESYTQSQRGQLLRRNDEPLQCAKIKNPKGIVELSVSDHSIVIRNPFKFGQVIFSAADFDTAPFADWVGQKNYLMKLTFGNLNLNQAAANAGPEKRTVVRYGQSDILGQLYLPLESFSKVQFISFTIVAVLIAIFIVCIGPLDYFLLRKFFGQMEWTWLTFSLLTVGFCGIAIFLANATKPDSVQINQLEIIDFDTTTNAVRGNLWTNLYSPNNSKLSISSAPENGMGIDTSDAVVSWMGLPGGGLGGMLSESAANINDPSYANPFRMDDAKLAGGMIRQFPLKVSSTKPLYTQYHTEHDIGFKSRLLLNRASNQLQGTITNPFDFELRECRVVFENWAYILRQTLEPGESVDVFADMNETTASSYYSRRVAVEDNKGGDVPWNPRESNIDRIAEIVMFYQSAGGKGYTRLTHGYRPILDMTEQLFLQRAILFCRADGVGTRLAIDGGDEKIDYDQQRTYLRIVLPVNYKKR